MILFPSGSAVFSTKTTEALEKALRRRLCLGGKPRLCSWTPRCEHDHVTQTSGIRENISLEAGESFITEETCTALITDVLTMKESDRNTTKDGI